MKALILAAGRGSRLGELTARQPKCMVTLAGRPLLQWQCDAMRAAGLDGIHVMAGYAADHIDVSGITLTRYPDWERTNMVGTLWHARARLAAATTLVAYGDIVYHPGIPRALVDCDADLAITYDTRWEALWRLRNPADPLADAESFLEEGGILRRIGGRAQVWADARGQYMGLLRFTPAGWAEVEAYLHTLGAERRALDMTSLLSALLARGTPIAAIGVAGRWCEVDSASDLALYEQALRQPGWSHDWRWDTAGH
ncbi:MAG: NTP transferase domain-containing protein [Curvibacter sp.]|jgi:choline kinase|nr:phosphocholine cytidylyltransferase family protein [Curvibacter sp.]